MHRLAFILLALWGMTPSPALGAPVARQGLLPGLAWTLVLPQPVEGHDAEAELAECGAMLDRQWQLLSLEGRASELERVNEQAGHQSARMSPGTFQALMAALEWKERSRGALDPLAGPMNRWWGLKGGRRPGHWPTTAELDSLLGLVRRGGLYVVELGVLLRDEGMELDLDPLLPGLLADRAVDSLEAHGQAPRAQLGEVWRNRSSALWELVLPTSEAWTAGKVALGQEAFARVRTLAQGVVEGHPVGDLVDPRSGLPVDGVETWAFAPTALEARALALSLAVGGASLLDPLTREGIHLALATRQSDGSWQWLSTPGISTRLDIPWAAGQ